MTTPHNTTLALAVSLLLILLCGCTATDADIRGAPTLSASFIDSELAAAGSPASGKGLGQVLYQLSQQYGIDNAYALAFFNRESSYGKNGVARFTRSLGNIRCTPGWPSCYEGFRSYANWRQGAADWYQLIAMVYIPDGRCTVASIIPKYAPAADNNDEHAYINGVLSDVNRYRNS